MPPVNASTPTLSTFTGANENPLDEGGNWFGPLTNVGNECQRLSNAAEETARPSASWWSASFAAPPEVWGKLRGDAAPGNNNEFIGLLLHGIDPATANMDGYLAHQGNHLGGGDRWQIYRYTNGTPTQIKDVASVKIGGGHYMIFRREGDDLVWGWEHQGTSVYTEIARVADTTYMGAGNVGIYIATDDTGYDEVGGGSLRRFRPQIMRY